MKVLDFIVVTLLIIKRGNGSTIGNLPQRNDQGTGSNLSATLTEEQGRATNEHQLRSGFSDNDQFPQIAQTRSPRQNKTVTIAVLGRRGSGVSSTISELIGPKSNCTKPDGSETFQNFLEYTITNIPSKSDGQFYTIKILDVPGFVDGRSSEDDSKILASLKSYVLSQGPPDFYLALSRFDDRNIDGPQSLFVEFLKRVEIFQNVFLNNTIKTTNDDYSNIVFLLTRLMSVTILHQRRPNSKISSFRRIIETFTNLQKPHTIVVGDNNAVSDYEVKVEGGYYKLPNKQYYPKNIWQALISSRTMDPDTANLLTSMMDNRETEMTCEVKFITTEDEWDFYDDVDAFSYLLTLKNSTVEGNEINTRIEHAFEQYPETRSFDIVQKIALQLRLQNDKITTLQDLPQTLLERASFFQRNNQLSAVIPAQLLNEAFKLKMPEYIPRLTVGQGYVVMSDEISPKTPFIQDIYEPSSTGYQFPNFMKCRKLFSPETQYFKSYSTTMSDYIVERLKYLNFVGKDNITEKIFMAKPKEGFNLQPEEGENVSSLTAINEHRILTCNLVSDKSQWILDSEFIEEVESLVAFDEHDRDRVNEWNSWFERWGSHVVTQGYGGGSIHGSIVGASVKNILESRSKIDDTLNAIVKYTQLPFNDSGTPDYRLYGGESDSNSENLYKLEDEQRNILLKNWETTLGSNFKMLTNEFKLEPISTIVKAKLGLEKGYLIENATDLLMNGKLKFTRKRKSKPNRGIINPTRSNNETGRPDTISSHQSNPDGYLKYPSTFQGREVLQLQINNTNQLIDHVESNLQLQKERDERQHQENLAKLERDKQEQQRRAKQRSEEMRRTQVQASQNRFSSYQTQLDIIEDSQKRKEEQSFDDMITEMKRQEMDADNEHKKLLEKLRTKNKEDEKKLKCTGWDRINPLCHIKVELGVVN